jgi:hypothetical protein
VPHSTRFGFVANCISVHCTWSEYITGTGTGTNTGISTKSLPSTSVPYVAVAFVNHTKSFFATCRANIHRSRKVSKPVKSALEPSHQS